MSFWTKSQYPIPNTQYNGGMKANTFAVIAVSGILFFAACGGQPAQPTVAPQQPPAQVVATSAPANAQAPAATPAPANTQESAPTSAPVSSAASGASIGVDQAKTRVDAGAILLDVRDPAEWIVFRVPNSLLLPLNQLASHTADIPKNKEIIVACRDAKCAADGRDLLLKAGLANVSAMSDSLDTWRTKGYPVVSGAK
jgi:rhodanese-related sulfurtransferase